MLFSTGNNGWVAQESVVLNDIPSTTGHAFVIGGWESLLNSAVTINFDDFSFTQNTTVPLPPTGLTATVSGPNVTLSWNASAGAQTYIVEVGSASGLSNLYNATVGAATSVSGSVPPATYYWRVRARNAQGTSGPSAEHVFSVGGVLPPGPPLNLTAVAQGSAVSISWAMPTTGGTVTQFRLEAGSAPGLANLAVINVAALSFSTTGVPAGTYYLRVRGLGPGGVGPPSAEVTLVVQGCVAPSPPSALTHSVTNNVVSLGWSPSGGGTPPITYSVHAGSGPGQSNLAVFSVGTATSVQATAPPGTYFVRIVANNACGASGPSNEVIVVVP
jgi:predicted phage tail protein